MTGVSALPEVPNGSALLAEADPSSLDELFSRDPLLLSQQDLSTIVRKLRADREKWAQDEAAGKKRATSAKAPPQGPKATITLDDVDFL